MSPIILAALMHAAPAQTYPNVPDLTPFTQPANYMSLRGVLILRYRQAGRWVSREEAWRAAQAQSANVAPGGERPAPFTRAANFMSARGFERLQHHRAAPPRS